MLVGLQGSERIKPELKPREEQGTSGEVIMQARSQSPLTIVNL